MVEIIFKVRSDSNFLKDPTDMWHMGLAELVSRMPIKTKSVGNTD